MKLHSPARDTGVKLSGLGKRFLPEHTVGKVSKDTEGQDKRQQPRVLPGDAQVAHQERFLPSKGPQAPSQAAQGAESPSLQVMLQAVA